MRFIYPARYENLQLPDEMYNEEVGYILNRNLNASIVTFSFEQFKEGRFKKYGVIEKQPAIYRGWMMTPEEYKRFYADIQSCGSNLLTTPEAYRFCHYLPCWYYEIKQFTAPSFPIHNVDLEFLEGEDIDDSIKHLNWNTTRYFVKDFVKSLSSEHSSEAHNGNEVLEIGRLLKKYRGHIDGGLVVRQFEEYKPGTEVRYFVRNEKVYSPNGTVPEMVKEVAKRLSLFSPFFSVDVAERKDGELRVIEIGDGQVSDLKTWKVSDFVGIF